MDYCKVLRFKEVEELAPLIAEAAVEIAKSISCYR